MNNNFSRFKEMLESFFVDTQIGVISLKEASKNDSNNANIKYFYSGQELEVIDMDSIAQRPYKKMRIKTGFEETENDIVSTADCFIVNKENQWFLIEFKDSEIKSDKDKLKKNILKKAYENWYMILDILYSSSPDKRYKEFDYNNPVKFARENVTYIVVCNSACNAKVIEQIRNHKFLNQKYTPIFMQRLKEYIFNDAYVYTEIEFERDFVEKFEY